MYFLKANQNKIIWSQLSINPNAISLLKENKNKNEEAIELLPENPDKIDWKSLSINPAIFELNYEAMRIANQNLEEELLKEILKPSRVFKYPDYDYLEELFDD